MMGHVGVGQGLESDRDRAALESGRMSATAQTSEIVSAVPSSQVVRTTPERGHSLLISPNLVSQVPKPAPRWAEGTLPPELFREG